MYLLFSYLGTWILRNWKVHFFFPPPSLKEPAIKPLLGNLVILIHITKHGMNTISKTTHIKQGEMALPHTSWTLQEYKHYFTVHTYSHNTTEKAFS